MASSSTALFYSFLELSLPTTRPPSQLIPWGRSDQASVSFVRRQLCASGAATIVVIGLGGGYDLNFSVSNSPGKVGNAMPDEPVAIALGETGAISEGEPEMERQYSGVPALEGSTHSRSSCPRTSLGPPPAGGGNPSGTPGGSVAPDATASMTTAPKPVGRNPGCFSL